MAVLVAAISWASGPRVAEAITVPYVQPAPDYLEATNTPPSGNEKLVDAIISCESGWNPNARNPGSSATGLGQFLTGTWNSYGMRHWGTLKGHSRTDARDSYELVKWVVDNYGTDDWLESRPCWGSTGYGN